MPRAWRIIRGLLPATLVLLGSCARAPSPLAEELLVLHGNGMDSTLELVPWNGDGPGRVISDGLVDVRAPAVFHDGSRMVFAARLPESAQMSLVLVHRNDLRRDVLAQAPGPVTGTTFLPDGSVVFAAATAEDPTSQALYRVGQEDPAPVRLTFGAGRLWGPVLLHDGRLLFARVSVGNEADRLLVVHPDGTGLAPYAELPQGSGRVLCLAAEESGDLHVLTRDPRGAALLWRVDADRPAPAGITREALPLEQAYAVDMTPEGGHLLAGNDGVFLAADQEVRQVWHAPADHVVLGVHSLAPRTPPVPHLSLVDPSKDAAELFCVDVRRSRVAEVREAPQGHIARALLRAMDGDVVAEVPVFEDGSFATHVPANLPVRVELLDDRGQVLAAEAHSFYLRPGERRGCIGCHESHLTAAPNQMPAALRVAEPVPQPATGGELARKEQP